MKLLFSRTETQKQSQKCNKSELHSNHFPALKLTYVVLVVDVSFVHHFKKFHFNLCLVEERLLVLDDFYSHVHLLFVVIRLDDLRSSNKKKKTATNKPFFLLTIRIPRER